MMSENNGERNVAAGAFATTSFMKMRDAFR
jgi:hypothetical protein